MREIYRSRRVGRVFAVAAGRHGGSAFTPLYLALGTRLHPRGPHTDDDRVVEAALTAAGLESGLVAAFDDHALDPAVSAAHRASQDAVGGRAGSPVIVVDGHGFFGPVLTAPPPPDRADDLLTALVTAATTPGFAALTRPYQGPPDFTA